MNYKEQIKAEIVRLLPLMGLTEWEHKVVFHSKQPDDDAGAKPENHTSMEVEADSKYLQFTIEVYPRFFKKLRQDPSNLTSYLIHELCHVILAEYDSLLEQFISPNDKYFHTEISERATERFMRAIVRARKESGPLS